jgi:DNA-binding LacI/PurR family transcriptional regulator
MTGEGAIFLKRATIADVAARAGVSKSTVSHALSGKRPISTETRQRILQAINELGYQPHLVAQRLAGQQSRTIGFVFPLYSPHIAGLEIKFIVGAANIINQADYAFFLLTHPHQNPDQLQRFAQSGIVDGFILMQVLLDDPRVEMLQKTGIPFVLVGRCADNTGLVYVDSDISSAMVNCVDHLAGLGHRTIAYLHQEEKHLRFSVRAQQAFSEICQQRSVTPLMQVCNLSSASGEAAMDALLNQHPDATAVIVWNDVAAWGAVQAIQRRGMHIPTDFSLITFDRSTITDMVPFKPTTVDIRPDEVASLAAKMLLKLLAQEKLDRPQVLIKPNFIIGESTASPPSRM